MLRELLRTYLLNTGWSNDVSVDVPDDERDRYWYHPSLGVRDFDTAVRWQMTREAHTTPTGVAR